MQSFLFFRTLTRWLMLSACLMSFSAMAQELAAADLNRKIPTHYDQEQNGTQTLGNLLKEIEKQQNVSFICRSEIAELKINTGNEVFSGKGFAENLQKVLKPYNLKVKKISNQQFAISYKNEDKSRYALTINEGSKIAGQQTNELYVTGTGSQLAASPNKKNPAQAQLITGTVISLSTNASLSGVSVSVKGTATGTTTGADGKYSINAPNEQAVLVFSYVGHLTVERLVGGQQRIDVTLEEDIKALDEIVVIGYGTQKKSDLTGAVTGIKAAEITRNKTTDVLSAMQGKLSGVQIASQSGELGAGVNITIRGANSIYGSSSPLFVIDGIPMDVNDNEVARGRINNTNTSNPMANINPADIESIEILKDASASAIYGSRGANGVVLITTKAGKAGTARIEYDGYVSFSRASKKLNVLNSDGYIEYQKIIDPLGWVNNQDLDGDGIPETVRDLSKVPRHDWQDEIFSTGISQSHNITVSGGSKTTTFSGGLGYLGEQGIINSNTNKRYSLRLRVDHQQSDKFKVGFNINTAYTALNGATTNGNGNGVKYGAIQNIILSRPLEVYDPSKDDAARYVSPASIINDAYKFNSLTKILLSTYADYKITKGLNFNITGGGVLSSSKGKEFYSKNTTIGYSQNGLGYIQNINSNSYTLTNRLTYQKSLANNSELNLMGAYEVNSYNFESDDVQAANFPDESTGIDNIAKGTSILGINSNRYKNNRLSWLGRANYNLLDRYLFTVSFRADGSDKFGANNKWGYFPSAAFAWKVSDENFMKNQSVISNLKARLSYGVTGNERIPPYQYLAAMQNTYYSSGGAAQLGLSPSTLANPDLKWENTIQYNAGLDFSLFRNRIDISADYYIKETKNTLLPVLISAQTGFREQYQNRGQINNTGVELMLHSNNVRSKNFQWETNFNITFNKNVIENLGDVSFIPVTVPGTISNVGALIVGQQIGTGYGYVFDGVYQIDDFTWQNNSDPSIPYDTRIFTLKPRVVTVAAANVQPGSFKFKDLNGDGVVDDINDRTVISHSQPKHYGGFSNTLRYKGFDLNLFFEWSYGREILNLARVSLEGFQRIDNLSEDFFYNRWTPNNPTNEYGTFVTNNLTGRLTSSYYVEDGSYLRFKTVTLGYNLPKNIASKVGASNARLYLSANNIYTWTKYSGIDPEVNYSNSLISGLDNLSYPRTKAFIIGVNVSF